MKFKAGDYVKVVVREVTQSDLKSGLFYPHFCGLAGTVDRIYDDQVCVRIDPDSLPEDIRNRHFDIQESIKRKWLNGLSGEARNKLTPEEKQFDLAYTILVRSNDLVKAKPGATEPIAIKNVRPLTGDTDALTVDPSKEDGDPDFQLNKTTARMPKQEESAASPSVPVPRGARAKAQEESHAPAKGAGKSEKSKPRLKASVESPQSSASKGVKGRHTVKSLTREEIEAAEIAFLEERRKALKKG